MSKANPTPAEYKAELEDELRGLKDGLQSLYTKRRIRTLENRLSHMYVPEAPEHKMIIVEGEIEVCAACINSLGNNVHWDLAHPKGQI